MSRTEYLEDHAVDGKGNTIMDVKASRIESKSATLVRVAAGPGMDE